MSGPLYMILASLAFTVMVGTVKVAQRELSTLDAMCWRGIIASVLALLFCYGRGIRIENQRAMAMRSILGVTAMGCLYAASKGLSLASVTLISKLQPLLVAFFAPHALGSTEKGETRIWLALAVGLVGCGWMLAPEFSGGSISWFGLIAFLGAFLSAGAHLSVRALGRSEEPYRVVFWFQFWAFLLSLGALIVVYQRGIAWPSPQMWPYVLGCGVSATAGQIWMTLAYHKERAAVVAAASYTDTVWALLGDIFIFGIIPSLNAWLGGALILISGGLLFLRKPKAA